MCKSKATRYSVPLSHATHVIGAANLFLFKEGNFSYMWSVGEKRTVIFPYLRFVPLLFSMRSVHCILFLEYFFLQFITARAHMNSIYRLLQNFHYKSSSELFREMLTLLLSCPWCVFGFWQAESLKVREMPFLSSPKSHSAICCYISISLCCSYCFRNFWHQEK